MSTLNKTAKTATTENYTKEQTEKLLAAWAGFCEKVPDWATVSREKTDKFIEELAEQFQKKPRSIIAKLSRHNVYKSKTEAKPASGTTKAELAEMIGNVLNLSLPEKESLAMAGKQALSKILQALAASVPIEVLTPAQQAEKQSLIDEIATIVEIDAEEMRDLNNLKMLTISGMLGSLKDLESSFNGFAELKVAQTQAD